MRSVKSVTGSALLLLIVLLVGCSNRDIPRVANACDLLTADEVSQAIDATAEPGKLVAAIGENTSRICSFAVGGNLGTVVVYLGEGVPSPTQAKDPGVAFSTSEAIYVAVGAQNFDPAFSAMAADLAQRAISRAAGD